MSEGREWFRQRIFWSIFAHDGERAWIEDVDKQFRERPVPGFHDLVSGPVKVDSILAEGDILELEQGLALSVYHTPGIPKALYRCFYNRDMSCLPEMPFR